jgi:putative phosphoesterase
MEFRNGPNFLTAKNSMRIAFLSDAHGNPIGVDRCLRAAQALAVEAVYFLGDAVGYLPGEGEVIGLLSEAGAHCQIGNHEAMMLGRLRRAGTNESTCMHEPAARRLGEQGLSMLRTWPDKRELNLDGHRVLLVHGSPSDPLEGYCYPTSDISSLEQLPYATVIVGHTHRPFIRRAGRVQVINAGSCGLPRDQGDAPSFAVYDSKTNHATIYRVRVDPEEILGIFRGSPIHDAVKNCLYRSSAALVGEYLREI